MKKNNIWRIIWVVGIYAVLVLILFLVIRYKVKWEYLDLNEYLYFYNCSDNLCTSQHEPDDNYYNRVLCEDEICPYIKELNDNEVILKKDNKAWIYNYKEDKIINNAYVDYHYIGNNDYIFTNTDNLQGVINIQDNKIVVDPIYSEIREFKNDILTYKQDNKYGIKGVGDKNIDITPQYSLAVLINDNYYAYEKDNKYNIVAYGDMQTKKTYNYVYSIKDIIIVFEDGNIDILDSNLNSKLIMKIPSWYNYTKEKERDSLKITTDDNFVYFNVVIEDNKYKVYKYDLNNNKLMN